MIHSTAKKERKKNASLRCPALRNDTLVKPMTVH